MKSGGLLFASWTCGFREGGGFNHEADIVDVSNVPTSLEQVRVFDKRLVGWTSE